MSEPTEARIEKAWQAYIESRALITDTDAFSAGFMAGMNERDEAVTRLREALERIATAGMRYADTVHPYRGSELALSPVREVTADDLRAIARAALDAQEGAR